MKETSLVAFAALALLWAVSPATADRAEAESASRRGPAISGDLAWSAPPTADPAPSPRRDVDEVLEREKDEDETKEPSSHMLAMDRLVGLIPVPRPVRDASRGPRSALVSLGLAVPLRC